jgi:hypothetical protein
MTRKENSFYESPNDKIQMPNQIQNPNAKKLNLFVIWSFDIGLTCLAGKAGI